VTARHARTHARSLAKPVGRQAGRTLIRQARSLAKTPRRSRTLDADPSIHQDGPTPNGLDGPTPIRQAAKAHADKASRSDRWDAKAWPKMVA